MVLVNMWPQDPSFHHQFSMCFSSSAFSSGPGDCFYFLVNSAKWVEGSCSIYLSYQIFFLIVYLNARCRPVCFPLLCSYLSPNPANIPQFIPEQFWNWLDSLYSSLLLDLYAGCFCVLIHIYIFFTMHKIEKFIMIT